MSFSHSQTVKITLVGNTGTGKTALRKRLAGQDFTPGYQQTRGYDFDLRSVKPDTLASDPSIAKPKLELINLQIWEIGGAEAFRYLAAEYCKKNHITVITLDLNEAAEELESQLKAWNTLLDQAAPQSSHLVVLQKSDALTDPALRQEKIARFKEYARLQGNTAVVDYSAKTNDHFQDLTSHLDTQIVNVINAQNSPNKTLPTAKKILTHPVVWGFLKWVVLPAALASALVFSGGLAAIPVVGAYLTAFGTTAALGMVTAALSLIGNGLNAIRKLCQPSSPTVKPAQIKAAPSSALSSSGSIISNLGGPQPKKKEEQRVSVQQEQRPNLTAAQSKKITTLFEGLVENTDEDSLFKGCASPH